MNLCAACHPGEHLREEHPVEIRPGAAVPEDLHLDSAYSITCATCHNAHGPHEADRPYTPQTLWERDRALVGFERELPPGSCAARTPPANCARPATRPGS